MSENKKALLNQFDALLAVTTDMVLLLKDDRVIGASAGDQEWLDASQLIERKLTDILPQDMASYFSDLGKKAFESGETVYADYAFRPDHMPFFSKLGMPEPIAYKGRMRAADNNVIVWVSKNMNDRKKLERKITHQAQRDSLTGAYNRRALLPVLEQNVAQSIRYDGICSLLLIDIDNFSDINDQFGWDAGDQLLRQIVTELHRMKRTSDFLARYGDDQLALFLSETNHEQAMLAGERVRRLVHELEVPYPTGILKCTVSVGVSSIIGLEDTAPDMLKRIEENLAVARQSGGNRVEGEG